MPRLPSVESLGARPTPNPSGGVVSYRMPAGGQEWDAVTRVGLNLSQIGDQIENQRTQARRSAQLNDAMGQATLALGELEQKYQRDQDFKTSPQRFADEAELVRQRIEGVVDDTGVKAAFNQKFGDLAIAKRLNVLTSATKQEGDYHVSRLDQTLDTYATAAASAQNPAEVALVEGQAEIAIADMQQAGWIRDVDAGNRRRGFMTKIDQAVLARDMTADPAGTADRLATDPKYAANLDPVARERAIDRGISRAFADRNRQEAEAEKLRKDTAEQLDKEAIDAFGAGRMDVVQSLLPQMRTVLTASRYEHWLKAGTRGSEPEQDDPRVYGAIGRMIYATPDGTAPDYQAVSDAVFAAHRNGQLKNSTMSQFLNKARELSRAGGPNTPYETEEAYVGRMLAPAPFDIGAMFESKQANMGRGLREFQNWARSQQTPPMDAQLRTKADEIIAKYRGGVVQDPSQRREQYRTEMSDLMRKHAAGTIKDDEYEKQRSRLMGLIDSLESQQNGRR